MLACICGIGGGGCRLAIDVDQPMCVSDTDCEPVGERMVCGSAGVCVEGSPQVGTDDENNSADDVSPALLKRYPCLFEPPRDEEDPEEVEEDPDRTVTVELTIVDFFNNTVPPGVTVQACFFRDLDCEAPIRENVVPNYETGKTVIDLPYGFTGFLLIEAEDFLPLRWSTNTPLLQDIAFDGPAVLTAGLLAGLSAAANRTYDPDTGLLIVEFLDCNGKAAEGVVLQRGRDLEDRAFYFAGGIADRSLDASVVSTTVGSAGEERTVGGLLNVPSGTESVRATLFDTDLSFAVETVFMRPSTVTYLRMYADATK